jgi:signal transduction histidine kinase
MEPRPLRVLMIEDNEDDARLVTQELKRSGYDVSWDRVDTAEALRAAMSRDWDVVTSDSAMPTFSGPDALAILRGSGLDVPFIVVSGTIGEENAVAMMKAGANDYVLKQNLRRLAPAIEREVREAESRRARRRAEEELERHRQSLYQSEKLAVMGQLLAGVAHELNNPLSIVSGQASLLKRATAGRPEAERAEKIEKAADRCARIVKSFLALARQRAPERHSVMVAEAVRESVELVAYPLRVDGIEVLEEIDEGVPTLWADGHQLQQVLLNLLTNAHQALRLAPPPRRITLRARYWAEGDRVVIEVADNGPGMPSEVAARVFEPFFTTKAEGQGTGLGLPLCAGIIEAHGGAIRVDTLPGSGATFRVELPVEKAQRVAFESTRTDDVSTSPRPAAPASGPRSILVVDDEPQLAELLAEILGSAGYDVSTAASGHEALSRLESGSWDLVLCDLRMPGMDGPTLYHEVARRRPGLEQRFVFLTGDTMSGDARRFLEDVGRPHLTKPFELAEIERTVAHALGFPPREA